MFWSVPRGDRSRTDGVVVVRVGPQLFICSGPVSPLGTHQNYVGPQLSICCRPVSLVGTQHNYVSPQLFICSRPVSPLGTDQYI